MKRILPELILLITDAYTGQSPHLPYLLRIDPPPVRRVRKPHGYYLLFYRLYGERPEINLSVSGPHYRPRELRLSLPREEPLEIELWPEKIYPFPSGATLLCGQVFREGRPLSGVRVLARTLFEEILTRTDGRGSFILFPRRVEGKRLLRRGQGLFIPGLRGGRRITLQVETPEGVIIRRHLRWPVGEKTRIQVEV
ncbi:MAG TPA: hypothetical protein ENJ40_00400 [Thermosulfurimonas dismutans]|uniref:Uncharacterized protein n=1 Tax=Thermosulfurimonas dismutans TaxID=999894 RepID=A0A7C3GT95_9BACT|nr:hypothetical protein [Thermosulfurimonas dismutans]